MEAAIINTVAQVVAPLICFLFIYLGIKLNEKNRKEIQVVYIIKQK